MHPILFQWGSFYLSSWHTFYVLSAFAAFYLLIYLNQKFNTDIPRHQLARLFIYCYLAGYFGARILSIAIDESYLRTWSERFLALLKLGPMTFYGGAIGAAFAGILYCRVNRLSIAKICDVGIPAGLLALAVGRLGCFLNGDDFGKAIPPELQDAPPWWAVTFPNLGDQIYRYPVQIWESLLALGILVILISCFQKIRDKIGPGSIGLIAAIAYGNSRFFLEYIRGDERGFVGDWLSTSQFISLWIIVICSIILAMRFKSHAERPKDEFT